MTQTDIFEHLYDIDRLGQKLISGLGSGFRASPCAPGTSQPDYSVPRYFTGTLAPLLKALSDLHEDFRRLDLPPCREHTLERFNNGRYGYTDSMGNIYTLSCGSTLHANIPDEHGEPSWVPSRIEHDGEDYFLWNHSCVPLDGLNIREEVPL